VAVNRTFSAAAAEKREIRAPPTEKWVKKGKVELFLKFFSLARDCIGEFYVTPRVCVCVCKDESMHICVKHEKNREENFFQHLGQKKITKTILSLHRNFSLLRTRVSMCVWVWVN
jgi:hypothetical protein